MKKTILLVASSLILWSCNTGSGEKKKYLKESAGTINSLSLIMDNELWNSEIGDEIRKYFAAPVDGLPQEEPIFSLNQIPPEVFSGFVRTSRNVLVVAKDSTGFKIKDNVYAKPQKIAYIQAQDSKTIIELIREHAPEIIASYKAHEIREKQRQIKLAPGRNNTLNEKLGISLTMSTVYKQVKQENNFFWIERETQKGTTNIIAYEMPPDAIPNGFHTCGCHYKNARFHR